MSSIEPGLREKITERLWGWRLRMQQAQANSVYAFAAAAFLWPMVEAVKQGNWSALIPISAGLGSGLLVNHIQQWQNEADGAWKIEQAVADNPALREELDTLLARFDAFAQAEQGLAEEDRHWFVDTLRTELERQGNLARFTHVTFSGNVTLNLAAPPVQDHTQALERYRREWMKTFRHLSLYGIDTEASNPTSGQQRLELAQVYIDLDTTAVRDEDDTVSRRASRFREAERQRRPLSALQAAIRHQHIVLLGDPGSGKSTFLTHLGLCLAAHGLTPEAGWLARLPEWPAHEANLVPITVMLRDFAQQAPAGTQRAEAAHLRDFIVRRLEEQDLSFATEALLESIDDGRALLLLDGLDEIPTTTGQHTFVRDAIQAYVRRHDRCRIIITCRTLSYREPAWQLRDLPAFTLAPFREEQIDQFIAAWYDELARIGELSATRAQRSGDSLRAAVRRPDLWRLAPNPLLLTVMALVHTHKGQLPEARARLYEDVVDVLLLQWEQRKADAVDQGPLLRQLLRAAQRDDADLKRLLGRVAFDVHATGGTHHAERLADIDQWQLQEAMASLHPERSHDWARDVIQTIKFRAGLLLEREPGTFTFPHRTFQEYLAGAHLAAQPDFAGKAARLATQGAFWREVILLAVGKLAHVNREPERPLPLLGALCPGEPVDTPEAWRQVVLAGDSLLEMGRQRARENPLGKELDERIVQRLVEALRTGHLEAVERVAAGNTLGQLGDPRFRQDAWYLPDEPLLGFVEIPAGRFIMGSDPAHDPEAEAYEQPQRRVFLPRYFIARYPVTVGQFGEFVRLSGSEPRDRDSLRGRANHPVVYVTWYDALAYCRWLTERLRAWDETPQPLREVLGQPGGCVTLPSEAEWEKAARWTDGRLYPWGNTPDANRANYAATGINATSAVGCFPQGASRYGIEDMAGNVWEWTRSLWGESREKTEFSPDDRQEVLDAPENVHRVLRGGAFWNDQWHVRCACRYGRGPRGRNDYYGFRVVVAVLP